MEAKGVQIEMNFGDNRNRFKDFLCEGQKFCVIFELNAPSRRNDFKSAVSKASAIEFAASSSKKIPVFFAFTDKLSAPDCWGALDFAAEVCPNDKDKCVVYMSGRDASLKDQSDFLAAARASGLMNIVPVSGDSVPGESWKETAGRVFTESVHGLHNISAASDKFFYPGAVVNPFKYTPGDSFSQYFKMIKKLGQGAEFLVAQSGWDMLKHQELRWYLSSRGYHYPSVARLLFLTPDRVEAITAGKGPRAQISPDFERLLKSELSCSAGQFEAAQWRRLQIQAAGCRLMGYSAVQIAGIETPAQAGAACQKIAEALEEFKNNFEDWKQVYLERSAGADMAPGRGYYMFSNLFSKAHQDETLSMSRAELPVSASGERTLYKLSRFLLANAHLKSPGEHYLLKKLLTGCRTCSFCRLPLTRYVCPEQCPKGLANGPCGGSKFDGSCEVGGRECVHARSLRLAAWLGEIDALEEKYIPPAVKPAR
jgi:methylenetetrahydrofolate reductase (NADPH)